MSVSPIRKSKFLLAATQGVSPVKPAAIPVSFYFSVQDVFTVKKIQVNNNYAGVLTTPQDKILVEVYGYVCLMDGENVICGDAIFQYWSNLNDVGCGISNLHNNILGNSQFDEEDSILSYNPTSSSLKVIVVNQNDVEKKVSYRNVSGHLIHPQVFIHCLQYTLIHLSM